MRKSAASIFVLLLLAGVLLAGVGPIAITRQSGVAAAGDSHSTSVEIQNLTELDFVLNLSAISGGGTFTAYIDTSNDKDTWAQVFAFTGQTSTGALRANWNDVGHSIGKYVAARWTLTAGTASFELTASGSPAR